MAGKLEKREQIGDLLRQHFGGPNQHNGLFIIRFGHQIAHDPRWSKGLDLDDLIGEGGLWGTIEDEDSIWPGVFFGYTPKQGQESEHEREDRLDKRTTRIKQKIVHLGFHPSSVDIMLHRACIYGDDDKPIVPAVGPTVTKDQISLILDQECCTQNAQDSHINLFYITVQKENTDKVIDILTILETLPGDWRKVEPQETWPDTFFGYFPKMYLLETERVREERLNREVRVPLKRDLEQKLEDPFKPSKVHILLTRACKN